MQRRLLFGFVWLVVAFLFGIARAAWLVLGFLIADLRRALLAGGAAVALLTPDLSALGVASQIAMPSHPVMAAAGAAGGLLVLVLGATCPWFRAFRGRHRIR